MQLNMLYLTTKTLTLLSFQTAELSLIECDIFRIFHILSTFGNENGGFFFIRFGVPHYWMDGACYAPNTKILGSKLWA
jgi:hypothetical protein